MKLKVEHYRSPKGPFMLAVKTKKSVPHLKGLVSLVISLNPAQETDVLIV